MLHGHRTNIKGLGIGFMHCATILYSGERHYAKLHTGSTLINWGAHPSQVVPCDPDTGNLQTWFRKERQLRFEEREQKIVDLLVKEALNRWDSWVREGARNYDDVRLNAYNTRRRGTEEHKAFKEAKGPALQRLVATSYSRLPDLIRTSYCSDNSLHVGASYVGQYFEKEQEYREPQY